MNTVKCRFCLEPHYPEAGSFSLLNIPFSIALKRVFSFEVKSEQHLPDYACKICSAMVWQFYTYSVMVEDNQHKLQQECALPNAEAPRNLAEGYRIEGHEHVAVKNEPMDCSAIHTEVPSCSSNLVDSAPINESSQLNIKVEPQDEDSTTDEAVVSREVASENKAQPVSANDGNIRMEEYVITTYAEGSNSGIAKRVTQEPQTEVPVLNREVSSESKAQSALETELAGNIKTEENVATTGFEESSTGSMEKVFQEHPVDDESTSNSNMTECDIPHDEPIEADGSCASNSQGNTHDLAFNPNDALLPCDQCERSFPNRVQLRNHQRVHKLSKCPICKKMIKGDFITLHLAAHEGAFRCEICDATFCNTANLRMHKDVKHAQPGDETFPCDLCERTFRNKTQLYLHRRLHTTKQCPICMKQVRSMHLQTHISIHQGAFYCDLCKRAFSSRMNLTRHNSVKHSTTVPASLVCDQCGLTFPNHTKLTTHRKGHQRKQCPVCKKAFRPNKMKEHLASHDGAFRCGSCGKSFSTKYSLKKHNRTSGHCGTEKSTNPSENESTTSSVQ